MNWVFYTIAGFCAVVFLLNLCLGGTGGAHTAQAASRAMRWSGLGAIVFGVLAIFGGG